LNTLPHSLESEQTVLGSVLCDPKLASSLFAVVKPGDFYADPANESLARAMWDLDNAHKPIDKSSILGVVKPPDAKWYLRYLSRLMETVQTTQTAIYHASVVAEKAQLRRLYAVGTEICSKALDGESDVPGTLADCDALLRDAVGTTDSSDFVPIGDVLAKIWKDLDAVMSGEAPKALMTPWRTLNATTGGMFPGEFIVVAASPATGKSAFAMQIVKKVASEGKRCLVLALEMGNEDTGRRMLGSDARIETRNLRRGDVKPDGLDRIGYSLPMLSKLPIDLCEKILPVARIRRICRAKAQDGEIGVVLIDTPGYVLEARRGANNSNKNDRLEHVYQELKFMASEIKAPVIAVLHFNRAGMEGPPALAYLRDGGNAEGIAQMVLGLHREDPVQNPTLGKIYVLKNRDGSTGIIDMHFDGAMFTWREAPASSMEAA
jgi:replicative DNA helicase